MANKEASVAELTDKFRTSNAVLLTEYRGLTVAQLKTLRQSIIEHATYAVVKNTLTKIAANDAGISAFDDQLAGPSAIAFVHGDTVAVAKALRDFAKANPLLVVKGGYFDGNALTEAEVIKLADLEARRRLQGFAVRCGVHVQRATVAGGSHRRRTAREAVRVRLRPSR
jgi:large subunit ribosomal protein L10